MPPRDQGREAVDRTVTSFHGRLPPGGSAGAVPAGRGGAGPGSAERRSGAGTACADWPLITKLELGPLPTAAGCGRDHARCVLAEWGLSHLADDAVLLVSELLTNALRASLALPAPAPIVLRLLANDEQLIIEAWDQRAEGYDLQHGAPDDEHGRGLTVVAALSKRWGAGRISSTYKVVWCEIGVARPAAGCTADGRAPRPRAR